jgi:hypothetical protein
MASLPGTVSFIFLMMTNAVCSPSSGRMRAQAPPLMFTSGPSHGVAMGTFGGEPLYHASLDAAEYRSLLGEHGFDIVAHKVGDPACGGRTVWLACLR